MLSYEIILSILMHLDRKDTFSFLSTSRGYYSLILDDAFWKDLIKRKYGIRYNAYTSWWKLYASDDAHRMCPHIRPVQTSVLHKKRALLWQSMVLLDRDALCMEPDCDTLTTTSCTHPIQLSLSLCNFMELWCHSCCNPVGFWWGIQERPISEKFLCRNILTLMTELPPANNPAQQEALLNYRRWVEQNLSLSDYSTHKYLIEKHWFNEWIEFLTGKTNKLPGPLDNTKLFLANHILRHDLIIGYDYELVNESIRIYIERVYGLLGNSIIISGEDYYSQPMYRGIRQSVLLHRRYIQ